MFDNVLVEFLPIVHRLNRAQRWMMVMMVWKGERRSVMLVGREGFL
jgi:hypothetical protein